MIPGQSFGFRTPPWDEQTFVLFPHEEDRKEMGQGDGQIIKGVKFNSSGTHLILTSCHMIHLQGSTWICGSDIAGTGRSWPTGLEGHKKHFLFSHENRKCFLRAKRELFTTLGRLAEGTVGLPDCSRGCCDPPEEVGCPPAPVPVSIYSSPNVRVGHWEQGI